MSIASMLESLWCSWAPDLAIRLVGDLHDLLIKREPLCIEEGFFELALPHRHIPDDEHRAAALGQPPDLGKVFFVRQAEGSGRKNDAGFFSCRPP